MTRPHTLVPTRAPFRCARYDNSLSFGVGATEPHTEIVNNCPKGCPRRQFLSDLAQRSSLPHTVPAERRRGQGLEEDIPTADVLGIGSRFDLR